MEPAAPVLYLRTDLSFGVRAGGSVGHIAGVLNELADTVGPPIMLTTAPVPTVRDDIETHIVRRAGGVLEFRELPTFVLNDVFDRRSAAARSAAARSRSCISATASTTMPASGWRGGLACRSCSNTTGRKSG